MHFVEIILKLLRFELNHKFHFFIEIRGFLWNTPVYKYKNIENKLFGAIRDNQYKLEVILTID